MAPTTTATAAAEQAPPPQHTRKAVGLAAHDDSGHLTPIRISRRYEQPTVYRSMLRGSLSCSMILPRHGAIDGRLGDIWSFFFSLQSLRWSIVFEFDCYSRSNNSLQDVHIELVKIAVWFMELIESEALMSQRHLSFRFLFSPSISSHF